MASLNVQYNTSDVEQFVKADRLRMSHTLQKEQSPRHAFGGLIPLF